MPAAEEAACAPDAVAGAEARRALDASAGEEATAAAQDVARAAEAGVEAGGSVVSGRGAAAASGARSRGGSAREPQQGSSGARQGSRGTGGVARSSAGEAPSACDEVAPGVVSGAVAGSGSHIDEAGSNFTGRNAPQPQMTINFRAPGVYMADQPSDACSRTNEDNSGARRKRKQRASDGHTCAYKEARVIGMTEFMKPYLTSRFIDLVTFILFVFPLVEEDDDVLADVDELADLLDKAIESLASVKAQIICELGPNSGIAQEILALFQEAASECPSALGPEDDELNAYECFSSDVDKFTSLMALPFDMKKKWISMQIKK